MPSQPVVFIHGLCIHSAAWEPWVQLYRDAGFDPLTPGWPGDGETVQATRANPSSVAGYGLADIAEHYTKVIVDLPQRPIIVGHSFGGLIAQQLLASGHATHAVAIDPGPAKGVTAVPLSMIWGALPVLRKKSNRDAAVTMSERQFRYSFGNAVSKEESRELFERWAIPGPGKPLFEATSAKKDPHSPATVDTAISDRGPLLITGGGKDHQIPEVVSRQAYQLYSGSGAVTDYHVFPDRGHSLVFDSGWREVADYALAWLTRH
ncbi:MAG: Alpha/beta hydrolase [Pseudonocardiales bacterium]|nr:Alpha/beta hydrolase [Pseudonocardiales bacterium]